MVDLASAFCCWLIILLYNNGVILGKRFGNFSRSGQQQAATPWLTDSDQGKEISLGQVSGIGIDSQGRLHVFHRGERSWDYLSFDDKNQYRQRSSGPIQAHTHLVLDSKSGRLLGKSGAKRYYMPHGLSLDRDDNVWLTDVAMHQVFKVKPGQEEPSLILGRAFTPGNDKDKFCKPTDVAVSKTNGDVFVADGYCNSRIVRFSANGVYLSEFGKPTNGYYPAPPGTFQVPHSVTLIEDLNLLCVADRENERIQCFSAGLLPNNRNLPFGTFVRKAEKLGRVFAVDNIDHFLIGVTNDGLTNSKRQLFTVDMETGDSDITEPGLMNPHDVAASPDGTIFVAEIGPNRILRLHV